MGTLTQFHDEEPGEDVLLVEVEDVAALGDEAATREYATRGWAEPSPGKFIMTQATDRRLQDDARRVREKIGGIPGFTYGTHTEPVGSLRVADGELYMRWVLYPRDTYESETDAFVALVRALHEKLSMEFVTRYFEVSA